MNSITTPKPVAVPCSRTPYYIGLSMLLAALLTLWLSPTRNSVGHVNKFNLEQMIPKQLNGWTIDESIAPRLITPEVQQRIKEIYSQTLDRTYINKLGERIMLSIAYGGNQTDSLKVHLPEGCYYGQGFSINDKIKGILSTSFGDINVSRLIARKGLRNEPITYWIVIGDITANDDWGMKVARLKYALRGQISDGMLVRISSISTIADSAFKLQARFAESLLEALPVEQRKLLAGLSIQ